MASIKDIAKEAKTSISSVSLVLNGKAKGKRISDALAERIKEAAERLGYHPNLIAVGLRTGKSKTVALVVEDISNHFFSSLAKTIEDEAKAYGYNVVFCSTENNVTKGKEVIRMLWNQQMDGYRITPITGIEKEIIRLVANGRPVVLMDGNLKETDIPYVVVNNFEGMQNGIELLIKKGYKNIGYVTVDQDKKRYAFAIGISNSKTSIIKTAFATTVIFIDPQQVILPVSNFSSYIYKETRTANFVNLSANGVSYTWNFGDGSALSTAISPDYVYAFPGTYTVTLTTSGIAGSGAPVIKSTTVTIL